MNCYPAAGKHNLSRTARWLGPYVATNRDAANLRFTPRVRFLDSVACWTDRRGARLGCLVSSAWPFTDRGPRPAGYACGPKREKKRGGAPERQQSATRWRRPKVFCFMTRWTLFLPPSLGVQRLRFLNQENTDLIRRIRRVAALSVKGTNGVGAEASLDRERWRGRIKGGKAKPFSMTYKHQALVP